MFSRSTCLYVFLFLSTATNAQYEPMAVEGAHWVIFDKSDDGSHHHMLKIEGDTTLNGIFYKKLYRLAIQSEATLIQDFLPPYYYFGQEQLIGLLRDDVPIEHVYGVILVNPNIADCNINEEILVYDFSLITGAYLSGCLHELQGSQIVKVDSVTNDFLWGKQREVHHVLNNFHRFVEGVGGEQGPFSTSGLPVPTNLQRVVDYCIGTDSSCRLEPVSTAEPSLPDAHIYPNPADEYLKIELGGEYEGSMEIQLTDFVGRLAFRMSVDCKIGANVIIPIYDLATGVYFLNIQSKGHASNYKILII